MYTIDVDNIKCGGCANTICKTLLEVDGVDAAEVDVDAGRVSIQGDEAATRAAVLKALLHRGYPETGSAEGMNALGAKAKSFVSCAVGRIDR